MALGAVAFSLSHTYAQSLVARCLLGMGAAATWLPGLRLIQEWFEPRERGLATGLFSAGGGVGGTTALLLLPILAQHLGWRVGYALLAVPVLATMVAVWFLVRAEPRARDAGAVAGVPTQFLAGMREVLATPALWPFNLYVLFSYGGYFALLTWLPTFLVKSEGLSQAGAGFVTALITGGTIVSWPLAGYLSDRFGRRKPIFLVSQATSVLVCLAFAYLVPGTGLAGAAAVAARHRAHARRADHPVRDGDRAGAAAADGDRVRRGQRLLLRGRAARAGGAGLRARRDRELPGRLHRLRGLRGGGPRHRHVCAGNRTPGRGMMPAMEILDPVGSTAAASRTLAPRPATLAGAVIGVLDNSKPNARVLLEGVARALAQKVGARDVKIWGKPGASIGATTAVLDEIAAQCGAVLTASAD